MSENDVIQIEEDIYQVLNRDPLYSERIRIGLKNGLVEIIPYEPKEMIKC